MVYETVSGRLKKDLEKFGTKAAGYIGKHIVGTGEEAHLTTKVYLDLLRPHVILICGKRGSGKSYSAGTIIEEILSLEKEYASKIGCVIFDPIGIYWSMKFPNELEADQLKEWKLEPKKFDQLKVYVPLELKDLYIKAGIPVDYTVSISPKDFSSDDWVLAFSLNRTSQEAITLGRKFNEMVEEGTDFGIDDFIIRIKDDRIANQEIKNVLINLLEAAKGWGIFSKGGMNIYHIVKPGQVSVIDFSRVKGEAWALRNLVAAWITRETYRERVLARKEEELAKVEGRKPEKVFPLTWVVAEEAHNFCPSDSYTVSTEPLLTLAKQGREPGISMVIITQMPNKVHQDILSQCDLVISFRLTSKDDLQALHAIMQTYVQEDLWKYINRLPRNMMGSAVLLDDNVEKIFTVNIRPRKSWHAGGTAIITQT